mgnify:CR=1 FL=1
MYAGCIITAVFQALGIIVVGMEQGSVEAITAKPVVEKAAKKEIEVVAPVAAAAPIAEPASAAAEPAAEAPAVALTVQEEHKA